MAFQDDDWNISESDGEGDLQQNSKNNIIQFDGLDTKRKKSKLANNGSMNIIPKKLALLYKDIEKNGWIELQCKCPRRGTSTNQLQNYNKSQTSSFSIRSEPPNISSMEGEQAQSIVPRYRPELQGFDYKEDEERPYIPKISSLKKTPMSAKRAKKVASMANVVNDLLRHKMLDEMEGGMLEKDCKKILAEDKEPDKS
eukprot:gene14025-15484_t